MPVAVCGGEVCIGDRRGRVKARREHDRAAHEAVHLVHGGGVFGRDACGHDAAAPGDVHALQRAIGEAVEDARAFGLERGGADGCVAGMDRPWSLIC
jgi:hypothetical protein